MAKFEAYTMKEYIEKNKLDVDVEDSFATKMIAKHLRSLGFEQRTVREGLINVKKWVKDNRKTKMVELAQKLARLEGRP